MGRIKLRHQEAETIIAKAKEQSLGRESQLQSLRLKGQVPPPAASLLGCWQVIEKNVLFNANPDQVTGLKLGDCRFYFTALTPDGGVFGKFVSSGGARLTGPLAQKAWLATETYDLTGRVIEEGQLQFRLEPKRKSGLKMLLSGEAFMSWLFRLEVTANWRGWEMEGTSSNKENFFEEEFKAVRLDPEGK